MRQRIKQVVERTDSRAGKAFDLGIQALIIFSLVSFAVETVPDLSPAVRNALKVSEFIVVGLFTLEYLLRILVADRRLGFVFSFYGLIDLAAILPFYLTTGIDLRSIRVLRLLRLVRIFKLVRYGSALTRLTSAFRIAKEELILFLSVSLMFVYIASVGIYYFENPAQPDVFESVVHSMWWAIVTLTTVGYGDMYPITLGGRLFTGVILLIGLGIVAVPAGIMASSLNEARRVANTSDKAPP